MRRVIALVVAAFGVGAFVCVNALPASAVQQISAKALTDHECNSDEWHFVINQIDMASDAPASIHVTWANNQQADVPLGNFTGGVAHYTTTANLNSTVTSATATIYDAWSGQFNLSHGPCNTPPPSTTAPTTTTPATTTPRTTTPGTSTPGTTPGGPEAGGVTAERPAPAIPVVAVPNFSG